VDRRAFLSTLTGGLLAPPLAAEAQQTGKIYRIGVVARPGAADTPHGRAFREGLRELGWVEGQTVTIDWRWTGGEIDRLDAVATKLVRAGVDVIVTGSTPATLAAKRATQIIPIVIAGMAFPVERGAVASLARPGGNVTGVSGALEAASKRFHLLKEAAPRVSRVAYLQDPLSDVPAEGREARRQATAADARKLGLDVRWIDVRNPAEIDAALTRLASSGVHGLYVSDTSSLFAQRERICAFARDHRLPAIGRALEFAEAGCLVSYGPNLAAMWGREATYVDRILRGARPADLPVEQPTKFELVINLKTAKALGLTIPPSLLQRADQVIE
jgi:putative tryptophan/tyrosine transport system substrate-binding protein